MMKKILLDATGLKRVVISGSDQEGFTFVEEHFSPDPNERCWIPQTYRASGPRCATFAIAMTEAEGRVAWLSQSK
jgi:hypothetical protein